MTKEIIEDINYFYFSPKTSKEHLIKRSFLKNCLFFFVKLFYNLLSDIRHKKFTIQFNNRVLFYSASINEYNSLIGIYRGFIRPKLFLSSLAISQKDTEYFSKFIYTFISFLYFPKFISLYLQGGTTQRMNINYSRNDIHLSLGFYTYMNYVFKRSKPLAVIISNDHIFSTRTFIHLCNQYQIPCFYIQHASASSTFPKLDMTYALLEGEAAKEVYLKLGSESSKIYLIGMSKSDNWIQQTNMNSNIVSVGYAINELDEINQVIKDVNEFYSRFPSMQLFLRPHPAFYTFQLREQLTNIHSFVQSHPNIILSNPENENVFKFLTKIDVLIAGLSSIHLEAALINVMCIQYCQVDTYGDYYGYVKNHIVFEAKNMSDVVNLIDKYKSNRPFVKTHTKHYVANVGTMYEGASATLALEVINKKLEEHSQI